MYIIKRTVGAIVAGIILAFSAGTISAADSKRPIIIPTQMNGKGHPSLSRGILHFPLDPWAHSSYFYIASHSVRALGQLRWQGQQVRTHF